MEDTPQQIVKVPVEQASAVMSGEEAADTKDFKAITIKKTLKVPAQEVLQTFDAK